ncbi:dipeptidyl carboxypeptidase II [Altererythrobacter sp. B11]|uniref:M3 family metallopeptidase n=1 Tax=Altererythrobacter sp. B11 TaxID=2060312 RepID=UPI000DC6D75C|nr:M3 family metallopeptidase [Altererythrobacter sp. B11]BBC74441.1 dipeptidyl carboxypeptidase II [Altererythrobacter sp. B11]
MPKSTLLIASALGALALGGCTTASEGATGMASASSTPPADVPPATGVFAARSTLPFHAPDFSRIAAEDFGPGFEQGMRIQQAEWDAIAANPEPPSFSNTIVALERSGRMLSRVGTAFNVLTGSVTNDALDAIDSKYSPQLAAHRDALFLNDAIFARVKAVYDNRAAMSMTPEDAKLLEETYKNFVHAGAQLSPEAKAQLREINTRLSALSTSFSQQLTEATKEGALVVDSREALAGLSEAEIAAAAKAARERGLEGKFVLPLQNTTQQPLLASLDNRATRKALYEASWNRALSGANDTRPLVKEMAALRARKAALFGDPDFAEYQMYDSMAEKPEVAIKFMQGLAGPTAATQEKEAARINALIKAEGGNFTVQPWDWDYYAAKVRQADYDYDENQLKQYFQVDRVLEDGVFFAANKLYGLTFKKRTDIPVWDKTVSVYTVYDKDGSELALFYFDPYARDNKQGGAWMSNLVDQSRLFDEKPVIYNVLNIPPPAEGAPALVSFDNVETMFHEFGHALHGMFADQQYPSLSGTAVARDFVEFPSQANEKWAVEPSVLANYAKHYQTGEPIPAALLKKVQAAQTFNQGYALGETLAAAMLDMRWHDLPEGQTPTDVTGFEAQALAGTGLHTDIVPPRYRTSYFRHIWASGYAAGYYAYLWTEMLAADTGEWFEANGGLTRANGDKFRQVILSRGGTLDYNDAFRELTGQDPQVAPLLRKRGMLPAGQ